MSGALDEPTPSARARSREELADYLLDIGATLAAYGCPSYRLEDVIRLIADVEGHRADPFALPTGLFLRVTAKDGGGPQVNRMTRVNDWGVDLARLTLVDEIFNDVAARRSTIEQARERIREIVQRPPTYSPTMVFVATAVVSGASAVFFKGGPIEVLVAAIVGAVIAGSRLALASSGTRALDPGEAAGTSRRNARRLLSDFFGGLFAASCAWLALRIWPGARPEVIVPAGAIALFPGMTFTIGVAEVAQKNVVAGGARLIESAVTMLLILFGVALIAGASGVVGASMPRWLAQGGSSSLADLPLAWQAVALALSSLGFGALFQVPRRWLWTTFVSSATGWIVVDLAVHRHLPGHVAAFCAALSVCMFANGLSRVTNRPAQLFQLPGMMLLVPGSFGFLSLGEFLESETAHTIAGTQRVFMMALVGAALVIGVLVANVLVPSRKLL